jgi:ATP-binding cassette subfamily F protein 3
MLAKMQPIASMLDDPTLSFDFPDPDELRPPLITLDMAAVGYGETPILQRLNLRIDPDDRIACSAATATARPRSRGCSRRS